MEAGGSGSGDNDDDDDEHDNYVDIKGYVWVDTKVKDYNKLYDSGEGVSGVKVQLKNKASGQIVNNYSVNTNKNGSYTLKGSETKVTKENLSLYYVEFDYSNLSNKYVALDYNINIKGSKVYGYSYNDSKAWTYQNDDEENKYGLSANNNYLNMNLGLMPLERSTESITKDVAYIKSEINGKEYVYYYGVEKGSNGGLQTVSVGNGDYTHTIYASDIPQENTINSLNVYITYIIKVDYNPQSDTQDRKYKSINVTSLVDTYNTKYFKFLSSENEQWKGNGGKAIYNQKITMQNSNGKDKSRNLYITFKLTDEAIKEIKEKGSFTVGNDVTMTGYHEYRERRVEPVYDQNTGKFLRYREYWVNFGEDNSQERFNKNNSAPGMTFSIFEKDSVDSLAERKITGRVFEDNVIQENENGNYYGKLVSNGAVLGNGKYDSNENLIYKVKVELLDENEDKVKKNYSINENGKVQWNTEEQYVETYTDYKGKYTLTGMPPRKI